LPLANLLIFSTVSSECITIIVYYFFLARTNIRTSTKVVGPRLFVSQRSS